jgi:hypothetical protein
MACVTLPQKIVALAAEGILYVLVTWSVLLGAEERSFLLERTVRRVLSAEDALK